MPPAPRQEPLIPTPLKIGLGVGLLLAGLAVLLLLGGSGGSGSGDTTPIAATEATTDTAQAVDTTEATETTVAPVTTVAPQSTDGPAPTTSTPATPPQAIKDLYSTPNFAFALTVMESKLGKDADLVRLQGSGYFLDAQVRQGTKIKGVRFDALNIAFSKNPVLVPPFKPAKEVDFPIKVVDPAAVDRILAGVRKITGSAKASIDGLDLRRDPTDNTLRWEITAETPAQIGIILYTDPDGRNIRTLDQQSALTSP